MCPNNFSYGVRMQLSNEKVIREGYVRDRNGELLTNRPDFDQKLFSHSSFNLKVREILAKCEKGLVVEDATHGSDHGVRNPLAGRIEPQQTVYVLSEERLCIPQGCVAYVFLKNRLSQKGLLALNTGIIDPGFNGPISTMLLNLSSETIELPIGEPFFRVVFHDIEAPDSKGRQTRNEKSYSYEDYRSYRIKEMLQLPKDFQNTDRIKETIDSELSDRILSINASNLTVILAILTALLVIVPPVVQISVDAVKDEQIVYLKSEFDLLSHQLRVEKDRLTGLEGYIRSLPLIPVKSAEPNADTCNKRSENNQNSLITSDKSS